MHLIAFRCLRQGGELSAWTTARARQSALFRLSNFQSTSSNPESPIRVKCETTVRRRSGMRERGENMTSSKSVSRCEYLIRVLLICEAFPEHRRCLWIYWHKLRLHSSNSDSPTTIESEECKYLLDIFSVVFFFLRVCINLRNQLTSMCERWSRRRENNESILSTCGWFKLARRNNGKSKDDTKPRVKTVKSEFVTAWLMRHHPFDLLITF